MTLAFDKQVLRTSLFREWDGVRAVRKPIIAAVNGYALGGACPLDKARRCVHGSKPPGTLHLTVYASWPEVLALRAQRCG